MNLAYPSYNVMLTLCENKITVLSIENPQAYSKILSDIWNQCQGGDGEFILSHHATIKSISKEIACIFNPFVLNSGDKKILNKLYSILQEQTNEWLIHESASLNRNIIDFFDKLSQHVPYALEYNLNLDIVNLFKSYDVKPENFGESLLERIVEYLRIQSQLCNLKIFVFISLKQYLTTDELKLLYEFVFYEKIHLIIIEPIHSPQIYGEKGCIIDKDLCIIDVDELTPLS
jgi:CRISPR-associated protein Csn2